MKNFKKVIVSCFLLVGLMGNFACKDFLNVVPKDRLTGNNFYKSQDDVEANMANLYSKFFEKINETQVIGAIGEFRTGDILVSEEHFRANEGRMIEALGRNDLLD